MAKSAKQLESEIRKALAGKRRIAHVGFGTYPASKFQSTASWGEQYQPTRSQQRDPKLPKGEIFTLLEARTLKRLGTSSSVEGAMQKAPAKGDVFVRGEYTSDGHHWGLGKGREVAQRENGRWLRG